MTRLKRVTYETAMKAIQDAGWKVWHPEDDEPARMKFYWDGVDERAAYAWLSAYEEIQKCKQGKLL
jgi:hypothetical protein